MSLSFTRKQVDQMVATLDAEYETVEEAAHAALATALALIEERASFVVVGQLAGTSERLTIPPNDPEAIKLSLGFYDTEGKARSAAESLWHSTASGDTFRYWVLPTFHGTPAELHAKRKAQYVAQAEKAAEKERERRLADIAKRDREQEERANGGKGSCANCGCQRGEHGIDGKGGYGGCKLAGCEHCTKFSERTKALTPEEREEKGLAA